MTIILKKWPFSKESYLIDGIHCVGQLWFDRNKNDLTGMRDSEEEVENL